MVLASGREGRLGDGRPDRRGHGLQLREVDVPAALLGEQGQGGEDGGVRRDHVAEPEREPLRLPARVARLAGESGHRRERVGEGHRVPPRAGLPHARHGHQDDVRVELAQRRVVHPPLREHAGTEVLHDYVAVRHEVAQQLARPRRCAG